MFSIYALPRLEINLFNNDGINELEATGNVKMKRRFTNYTDLKTGNNISHLTTSYKQDDFDEYYGFKMKDKKVTYDTLIDELYSDISSVVFHNTFIMADLQSSLLWSSCKYTLTLINKSKISYSKIENLKNEIYVESLLNDYQLTEYEFTIDEWRGIDIENNNDKEEHKAFEDQTEDDLKQSAQTFNYGNDTTMEDDEERRRRRLLINPLKIIEKLCKSTTMDVVTWLFDNKEHFVTFLDEG